jgi:hypothetical protein
MQAGRHKHDKWSKEVSGILQLASHQPLRDIMAAVLPQPGRTGV